MIYLFIYLKGSVGVGERWTCSLIHSPNGAVRLDQAKVELHLDLRMRCRGCVLGPSSAAFPIGIWTESGASITGSSLFLSDLTHCATMLAPYFHFY